MNQVIWLEETASTNKYAIEHFDGFESGTAIFAGRQTAGKGRRGRTWISPAGENIYASFIYKGSDIPAYSISWIGALAALECVREIAPESHPWLKWPNDIYIGYEKLAGLLCEVKTTPTNQVGGVVIGIGLNVNMPRVDLNRIGQPATSLSDCCSRSFEVRPIAMSLAAHMNSLYLYTIEHGVDALFSLWKDENFLLGKLVEVVTDAGLKVAGRVVDISRDGEIIMDVNGKVHVYHSGDVTINKESAYFKQLDITER